MKEVIINEAVNPVKCSDVPEGQEQSGDLSKVVFRAEAP